MKTFFHLPETLRFLVPGPWHEPTPPELAMFVGRLRLLSAWLLILLISVVLMWRWGLRDSKFTDEEATPEALSSWRREVRRGRFGRAQSKLLVTTVVVAAVLLLSWVSCLFTREGGIKLGIKIPVALLPILSAIAGSIFTAMRSTPVPTEDHEEPKQPSWISRLVFAATPPLVVSVLAVAASAIVHWLLLSLSNPDSAYQSSIYILLSAAAILSIALCMGLAIYELQGVQWSQMLQLKLRPVVFFAQTQRRLVSRIWAKRLDVVVSTSARRSI